MGKIVSVYFSVHERPSETKFEYCGFTVLHYIYFCEMFGNTGLS